MKYLTLATTLPLMALPIAAEDDAGGELIPCPGCVDESEAPTCDNSDAVGGHSLDSHVTKISGECFLVPTNDECSQADPCTPILRFDVFAPSAAATATGRGAIGGVGTGTHRQEWGLFEGGTTKTIYEDYVEVGCGSDISVYYGVSWLLIDGNPLYGTSTANGELSCTACAD